MEHQHKTTFKTWTATDNKWRKNTNCSLEKQPANQIKTWLLKQRCRVSISSLKVTHVFCQNKMTLKNKTWQRWTWRLLCTCEVWNVYRLKKKGLKIKCGRPLWQKNKNKTKTVRDTCCARLRGSRPLASTLFLHVIYSKTADSLTPMGVEYISKWPHRLEH